MKKITDKIFCAMKNKNIMVDEEVVKYGLEIIFTKVLFDRLSSQVQQNQ